MDAFLINGGDGFYQAGVPWGDFDAVPGEKGASGNMAESPKAEEGASVEKKSEGETFFEETAKIPVEETPVEQRIEVPNKPEPEPQKTKPLPEIKEAAPAVTVAEPQKPIVKKVETPPVSSKKSPVKKSLPKKEAVKQTDAAGRAGGGQGGTGTRTYGGAIGDAPGFGAGQGTGIGIGTGKGVGDVKAARYFVRIRRLFQRRLKYPEEILSQKISGKTIVQFHLQADGKVVSESIHVVESSGYEILDNQAIRTVQEVPSLPEPPFGEMTIEIPIVFRVYR